MELISDLVKLQCYVVCTVSGKITASLFRTVNTTAYALGSVTVRAGKSCVKADLENLFPETVTQIIIVGVIAFVVVRILKIRFQNYFYPSFSVCSL